MGLLDKVKASSEPKYAPPLTKEECSVLLLILQDTTFKGKDIHVIYELIRKIEDMYQYYNN